MMSYLVISSHTTRVIKKLAENQAANLNCAHFPYEYINLMTLTLRAQKIQESAMQACPERSRKLLLKISRCHSTCKKGPRVKHMLLF